MKVYFAPQSRAVRTRLAIEELGPTFIKLGQLLSTRPDLAPAHVRMDLSRLQDSIEPAEFSRVRELVEAVNLVKRHQKPNPMKGVEGGIVEKEARVAEERPVIAGVYWNRIQRQIEALIQAEIERQAEILDEGGCVQEYSGQQHQMAGNRFRDEFS